MVDCEKYQELISRLIDGDLDDGETAAVEAHIAVCPECAALYRAFASLSGDIRDDLCEPPAELLTGVMSGVKADAAPNVVPIRRRRGKLLALAACLALVIAGSVSAGLFGQKSAVCYTASSPDSAGAERAAAAPDESPYAAKFAADYTDGASETETTSAAAPTCGDSCSNVAAGSAEVSAPDGYYKTDDSDIISRLSGLLSPVEAVRALPASAGDVYTVTLPGEDAVTVTVNGDTLSCRNEATGETFTAGGSAADFTALIKEMTKEK